MRQGVVTVVRRGKEWVAQTPFFTRKGTRWSA